MAENDLIRLVLEGSPDRHGNIPADIFLSKLRQFIATLYSFDRAFAKRDKRSIELEVVDLRRVNPAIVSFRPRPQVGGYDVQVAMDWTVEQLVHIHDQGRADIAVPQSALDNVVELARFGDKRRAPLSGLRVEYRGRVVQFDQKMEANALVLRSARAIDTGTVWKAGVSKGSLFGELRGVMDMDGERQFYIVPPSGADRVLCIFPEEMRQQMIAHLFQLVRVNGYLRYDGATAFPYLVEAESIEGVTPMAPSQHFANLLGAFAGYERPEPEPLV
jgi:hypothetical protein